MHTFTKRRQNTNHTQFLKPVLCMGDRGMRTIYTTGSEREGMGIGTANGNGGLSRHPSSNPEPENNMFERTKTIRSRIRNEFCFKLVEQIDGKSLKVLCSAYPRFFALLRKITTRVGTLLVFIATKDAAFCLIY